MYGLPRFLDNEGGNTPFSRVSRLDGDAREGSSSLKVETEFDFKEGDIVGLAATGFNPY